MFMSLNFWVNYPFKCPKYFIVPLYCIHTHTHTHTHRDWGPVERPEMEDKQSKYDWYALVLNISWGFSTGSRKIIFAPQAQCSPIIFWVRRGFSPPGQRWSAVPFPFCWRPSEEWTWCRHAWGAPSTITRPERNRGAHEEPAQVWTGTGVRWSRSGGKFRRKLDVGRTSWLISVICVFILKCVFSDKKSNSWWVNWMRRRGFV